MSASDGGDDDDPDHDDDADDHKNHLIDFVGGNMPARFDWADIRVLSTSVLLTNTCQQIYIPWILLISQFSIFHLSLLSGHLIF